MSYHSLILTAGISALAQRNEIGKKLRSPASPLQFDSGLQSPTLKKSCSSEEDAIRQCKPLVEEIHRQQHVDESCISAEYSLLNAVAKSRKGLAKEAVVHLIHTPTFAGRLSVILQQSFLENRLGVKVKCEELKVPFDPAQPGGLAMASGAFMGTISRLLRPHHPNQAAFAPIGGYKSMVALGHSAASFHGFPSLYLHEDSQVLQEIAPMPIQLDPALKAKLSLQARRMGGASSWQSLSPDEQSLLQSHPTFFTRLDDVIGLSEFGEFLKLDAMPIYVHQKVLQKGLLTAQAKDQILQFTKIAEENPNHHDLRHELQLKSYPSKELRWRLFKQGGQSLRIVWQETPQGILIYHLWNDHEEYERHLNEGRILSDPLPHDLSEYTLL